MWTNRYMTACSVGKGRGTGTNPTVADTDGDGAEDGWEVDNDLDPTSPPDAGSDADNDGRTAIQEYVAGTNPNDPDTDDDTMTDGWELDNGLDPLSASDSSMDADADGLENADEFTAGTNALNNDTDADQLLDGPEVNTYGSNPFVQDTDADGLKDGMEEFLWLNASYPIIGDHDADGLANGIVDADSDGDGLNDTAEFVMYAKPHVIDSDGDGLCDGGTTLLCPAVFEATGALPPGEATYGSNPSAADSDSDGLDDLQEVLLWDPAGTGQAEDSDADEIPGIIDSDSDGDDLLDGDEVLVFHSDPRISDTDADQLADGAEAWKHHTDPVLPDSDSDNLTDGLEVLQFLTDPLSHDTDNDTLADGAEIQTHLTNARNPDSDEDAMPDPWELLMGLNPNLNDRESDLDGDGVPNLSEYVRAIKANAVDTDFDTLPDGWEVAYDYNPASAADGSSDNDGDGLSAIQEFVATTAPDMADTDADGVMDGSEVVTYGSNPKNVDTDVDGLKDGAERDAWAAKGIPLSGDPDGDGLANALVDDDFDGDRISDPDELTIGTRPDKTDTDNDGLSDHDEVYVYGGRYDPTKWDTNGDGLSDGQDQKIRDPNGDPDGDGLTNAQEDTYGTYKLWDDSDCDGVKDLAELNYWKEHYGNWVRNGVNMLMTTDVDGDGVVDGGELGEIGTPAEIVVRTDPLLADSDDDELSDGEEVHNEAKVRCPESTPRFLTALTSSSSAPSTATATTTTTSTTATAQGIPAGDPFAATVPRGQPLTKVWQDGGLLSSLEVGKWYSDPSGYRYFVETGTSKLVFLGSYGVFLYAPSPYLPASFQASVKGTTSAGKADSDGDGIKDGRELNRWKTDPMSCDSDGDKLGDAVEVGVSGDVNAPDDPCRQRDNDVASNGYVYLSRTINSNPVKADTDNDGINDGQEDLNRNGKFDEAPAPRAGSTASYTNEYPTGEILGLDTDSDDDGLSDAYEKDYRSQLAPNKILDPSKFDTDGDGLSDGVELGQTSVTSWTQRVPYNVWGHLVWSYPQGTVYADHANAVIPTNPLDPDSDDDGIPDGLEDLNQNGRTDRAEGIDELDPTKSSTDGDKLPDGLELLINAKNSEKFFGQFMDKAKSGYLSELKFDANNPWETNPRSKQSDGDGAEDGKDLNPRADDVFFAIEFGEFYTLEKCDRKAWSKKVVQGTYDCEFFLKELAIDLPFTSNDASLLLGDTSAVDYKAKKGNNFPAKLVYKMANEDRIEEPKPDYMALGEASWKIMRAGTKPILVVQLPNKLLDPDGAQRLDLRDRDVGITLTLGEDDVWGNNDIDLNPSKNKVAAEFKLNLLDDPPLKKGADQNLDSFVTSVNDQEAAFFRSASKFTELRGKKDSYDGTGPLHNEDAVLKVRMGDNLPEYFMDAVDKVRQSLPVAMPEGQCWGTASCVA